jgi:hypothetical protein
MKEPLSGLLITGWCKVRVPPRRRLPARRIQRTQLHRFLIMHIEQHNGEAYRILELMPTDPVSTDRPPKLYEPVLLGFAPLAFRLRGFERVEGQEGGYGVGAGVAH